MRFSRTRAGCLTCRSRRKKCDEVKPRCAGCRRNQLPCNWPPSSRSEDPDQPQSSSASSGTARSSNASTPIHVSQGGASTAVARHPVSTSTRIPPSVSTIHKGADSDTKRACMLTEQSVTLLSHFLAHTASLFAMGPLDNNPFVTVLLPRASTDDLLMHSLLALSGAHLASKDPNNVDIAHATNLHYSRLIGGLRSAFSSLGDDDLCNRERLLRLLMVACHYEAVSGNTQGAFFSHLRASRHLVTSLMTHRTMASHLGRSTVDIGSLGFSLELYSYLMLCNGSIVPSATGPSSFVETFAMPLREMASFPTFGTLYAGSHEMYGLIPEIGQLASRRLAEEAAGSVQPSSSLKQIHDRLKHSVSRWEMPPSSLSERKDQEFRCYAAETLRHALHVYIMTSLAGSIVSSQEVRSAINNHIADLFWYVRELVASDQQYVATLLWPIMIGASCIVKPLHQQQTVHVFRESWSGLKHMVVLADVLELMWADSDPRAYGPYGLSLTMQKHGKVVGIL